MPVAYEIANTPQVLNAAPSPHRDSRPRTVGRRRGGRNTSRSGTADRSSSALIFSNDGVSAAFSRTITPKTTSTMLIKNAMRQPYDSNAASGSTICRNANTPVPNASPSASPTWGTLPASPRRRGGLCSTASSMAPAHSPPSANPCTIRSNSSSTGASTPICAAVGSSPISAVAPPIRNIVSARVFLRPMRSPTWPKTNPPIGPDDEPDGERRERQQRPHERTLVREERVVEDEAGRRRVEEEVVPLDGGADEAGQQGRANRRIESGLSSGFGLGLPRLRSR